MSKANYLITTDSVILVKDSGVTPIHKSHKNYNRIVEHLKNGELDNAFKLADRASHVEEATNRKFVVKHGCIYINKKKLPDSLSDRLLAFVDAGLDCTPLELFWRNLRQNPLKSSRESLYDFLENGGIPITDDGCFMAYKCVNGDFTDCHTGKFDNHPGKVVKMKRRDVDPNRNQTCSKGLHVAAFKYADDMVSGNCKLVEVKVNPKDVVAVPNDYDNMKMRVCRYEVIRECAEEIKDIVVKNQRTYYYAGTKKGSFNPEKVTSHKPSGKFLYTIRAGNTEEAAANFKKYYWSK